MRIRTTGDSEYRLGLYDDVGELLDENTRSGAIDDTLGALDRLSSDD